MSRPDINVLSLCDLHGTLAEPKVIKLGVLKALRDEAGRIVSHDTLKITNCTHLHVEVEEVEGGLEDVIDVNNRCFDIRVIIHKAVVRGKYLATVKGGCANVCLLFGVVEGRGSEMDVDIGNRSDQSNAPTEGVSVILGSPVPSRLRYRVINGRKPLLVPSGAFESTLVLPVWIGQPVHIVWSRFANLGRKK